MKKTKLNKKVLFGVVLACLMIGVVAGTMLVQKQVQMQVEVIPIYELQLLCADKITPFESWDFGTVHRNGHARSAETIEEAQWLINIGEDILYIYWNSMVYGTGDLTDMQIHFEKAVADMWTGLTQGTPMNPGEEWQVRFHLQIYPETAFGVHSWTTTIEGRDNP